MLDWIGRERAQVLVQLLDRRRELVAQIASMGGVATHDALGAVRALEDEMRRIDETLGEMRFGIGPVAPLEKAMRLPHGRGLTHELLNEYGPTRRRLLLPDRPYTSPIDDISRHDLDAVLRGGETGYSMIREGGDWLDQPGITGHYRMYNRAGRSSDQLSKMNIPYAAQDLGARRQEQVEGNVINAGDWDPPEIAHMRPFGSQKVETTPQVGLVSDLADENAVRGFANKVHKRYVQRDTRSPAMRPGSWWTPDAVIVGDLKQPPPHFHEITLNHRPTSSGRQVVYTRGRALPGFRQRRAYAHEELANFIK